MPPAYCCHCHLENDVVESGVCRGRTGSLDGGRSDWNGTMSVVKQVSNARLEKLFISTKLLFFGVGGAPRYEVFVRRLCV